MKIFRIYTIAMVLFFSCHIKAQKAEVIDSLWQKYSSSQNDSIKLKAANFLAFHYIFRSPERADSILRTERPYAKNNKLYFNLTELTNTQGIYYDVLGQKDSSKVYFERALKLSRKFQFPKIEVMCINNLGMFCWNTGEFKEAIDYFYQALEFNDQLYPDNDETQETYLNNIGLIYQELNQFEKAIEFHKKALAIRLKYDMTKDIAGSYNNLAICYKSFNDLEQAETYIRLAIKYTEMSDQPRLFYQFHDNLGNILNLQKKYSEAEQAYLTALDIPEEYQNNKRSEFITYSNLIELYNDTNQFNKAKSIVQKSDAMLAQDSSLYNFSESFYINGAKTYYALQELEKADVYFEAYTTYKDSLFSDKNAKALADVEAKLKTKEKEAELAKTKTELLEKELKVRRQNLIIYGSTALIIILIVLGYFIIQSKQLKNKKIQKESELKSALAKIELKNKLEEQRLRISRDLHDNIGSQLTFVISGLQYIQYQKQIKLEDVKTKLEQLSTFTQQTIHELRDTIWAMNKEVIELSDLIIRLNNFINQLDIKENISVSIPNEIEVKIDGINFSALSGIQIYRIIQESINNAVKHAEAKNIKINFNLDSQQLKISIEDDGKGFEIGDKEDSNGLQNIEKRVEKLKGKYEIKSSIGLGSSVHLEIPLSTKG